MKVDGQCHCGAIVYEAEVEPGTVGVCHCLDCHCFSGLPDRRSVRTFGQRLPASAFSRDSRATTSKRAIAGQSAFMHSVRSAPRPFTLVASRTRRRGMTFAGVTSDDEIVIALNLQRPIICCIHDAMSGRSTPVLRVGHVFHPIDG